MPGIKQLKLQTNIKSIAKEIDIPVNDWKGNCYGIACACVNHNIVKGIPRYGHYLGYVAEKSMFFNHHNQIGFSRHGWVELPDGKVYDPTRWVFENVEPYIYIGSNKDYDIGGSKWRDSIRSSAPAYNPLSKRLTTLDLSPGALQIVNGLLGDTRNQNTFCLEQMFWFCNENPKSFGTYAKEIYSELERQKETGFIPIDYWTLIN